MKINKINEELILLIQLIKLFQSGEGNRHTSPGHSKSPEEVGPKEAHTKAYHNYISQDER